MKTRTRADALPRWHSPGTPKGWGRGGAAGEGVHLECCGPPERGASASPVPWP